MITDNLSNPNSNPNSNSNFENELTLIELDQSNNFEYIPSSPISAPESPLVRTPIRTHHNLNNHLNNQTPVLNHHHINNQTINLQLNQTVTLQSTNQFSQQQFKLNPTTTTPVLDSLQSQRPLPNSPDSGFKLCNETVVLQNSNQQIVNRPRLNPFSSSTPLVNRGYDDLPVLNNQSNCFNQAACFSPIIKNDDYVQPSNFLSIKSLQTFADDSLLCSLNEDIENESYLFSTLTGDDDFDLIL